MIEKKAGVRETSSRKLFQIQDAKYSNVDIARYTLFY